MNLIQHGIVLQLHVWIIDRLGSNELGYRNKIKKEKKRTAATSSPVTHFIIFPM